jgi:hypothetical protein
VEKRFFVFSLRLWKWVLRLAVSGSSICGQVFRRSEGAGV